MAHFWCRSPTPGIEVPFRAQGEPENAGHLTPKKGLAYLANPTHLAAT